MFHTHVIQYFVLKNFLRFTFQVTNFPPTLTMFNQLLNICTCLENLNGYILCVYKFCFYLFPNMMVCFGQFLAVCSSVQLLKIFHMQMFSSPRCGVKARYLCLSLVVSVDSRLLQHPCFDVCRRGSLLLWTHCLLLISDVLWTQNGEIFPKMGILLPVTRKHPRSRNAMIPKGRSSWLNVEISVWALPTPPPCTVDIHAQGTCLLQPRSALTCSLPLRLQPPATLALGHCVVVV